MKKALEFNETDYEGRKIYVNKAGEGRYLSPRRVACLACGVWLGISCLTESLKNFRNIFRGGKGKDGKGEVFLMSLMRLMSLMSILCPWHGYLGQVKGKMVKGKMANLKEREKMEKAKVKAGVEQIMTTFYTYSHCCHHPHNLSQLKERKAA